MTMYQEYLAGLAAHLPTESGHYLQHCLERKKAI